MIYPVKVFDKDGNLKKIISTEELQEHFWNPKTLKTNSHFFALKDKHSSAELDRKLTHGTFHPKIP
jgi:hypothetical protein